MLLPGVLSFEGIPHALRVIGAIPPVFIFAGLGGWKIYEFLRGQERDRRGTVPQIIILFLFLLMIGISEFNKYFYAWGKNPNVKAEFTERLVNIGNFLNSLPEEVKKYVIVNEGGVPVPFPNGIPMPAQTPMFIERTKYGEPRARYLLPENLSQIKIEREVVILPMNPDNGLFEKLSQMFPEGEKKEEQGIWIYEINPKF